MCVHFFLFQLLHERFGGRWAILQGHVLLPDDEVQYTHTADVGPRGLPERVAFLCALLHDLRLPEAIWCEDLVAN